jgi:pyruvate ferredoxin oxidoreductase gamma subunit
MFEIVIHGRGGQGAKTASQLIVEAAMDGGKYIQAFPEYGPERTGAPMRTFARISDEPIKTYQPITDPDAVLVIDPTLLDVVNVTAGLSQKSILIVNTPKTPAEVKKKTGFTGKVYTVDATAISMKYLGLNMPNTPILGALIKAKEIVKLEALLAKVEKMFLKKIGPEKTKANVDCIKSAYQEAKGG